MRTGTGKSYRHLRRTITGAAQPNPNPNTGTGQLTTTNGVGGGANHYFEIGGADDSVSAIMIRWFDATSNATITLQTTNLSVGESAFNSEVATEWANETATITGPTGVAAGCSMLHIADSGAYRHRLKVVAAANTQLEIIPTGIH